MLLEPFSTLFLQRLPILVLCFGSILTFLQSTHKSLEKPVYTQNIQLFTILISLLLCILNQRDSSSISSSFILNGYSNFGQILILSIALVVSIMYKENFLKEKFFRWEISSLYLISLLGMMIVLISDDLIILFIGLELASLSTSILIGYIDSSRTSTEGSIKFFILGSMTTIFISLGFALIYSSCQSLNLATIIEILSSSTHRHLAKIGCIFVFSGLSFKLALCPFHQWAPDIYESAPTGISAYIATSIKVFVVIFILKLLNYTNYNIREEWQVILYIMASLSIIYGNLLALTQTSIKRMLAYLSIGQSGYLCLGILSIDTLSVFSYTSIILYLMSYCITNLLAFSLIMLLENKEIFNLQLDDLNGLSKNNPKIAFALAAALLSFPGIPPTLGFISKLFIFTSALQKNHYIIVVIAMFGCLLSLYSCIRIISLMYTQGKPIATLSTIKVKNLSSKLVFISLFVLIFSLGKIYSFNFKQTLKPTSLNKKITTTYK